MLRVPGRGLAHEPRSENVSIIAAGQPALHAEVSLLNAGAPMSPVEDERGNFRVAGPARCMYAYGDGSAASRWRAAAYGRWSERPSMTDHPSGLTNDPRWRGTLSESLKAQTRDWHNLAAGHPFERRLLAGQATRDDYARYLGQLLHVHLAVEQPLRDRQSEKPIFSAVLHGYHFRVAALLADLRALDQPPAHHPPRPALPATGLLCGRITDLAAQMPVALLGTLYVLEGSTNGGRYLAPGVRKAAITSRGWRPSSSTASSPPCT